MSATPLLLLLAALLAGVRGESACHAPALQGWRQALQGALEEVSGAECRRQVVLMLQGINNLTDWAISMADATAKVPSGLLRGNLRSLGDMDLCVAAAAPGDAVRGKYCLASIHLDADDPTVLHLLDIATGGRRNDEFRHRMGVQRNGDKVPAPGVFLVMSLAELGVCVPAACTSADVQEGLRAFATRLTADWTLHFDVRVAEHACRTREGHARPLSASHYAFMVVLGGLIFLVIIGTAWDTAWRDESKGEDVNPTSSWQVVLSSFSLRTNWRRLTSDRREEIGCIAGLRALTSLFMLFTHINIYVMQEPYINKTKYLEVIQNVAFTPFFTGTTTVETFFTLSGILYSYVLGDIVEAGKFSYIPVLLYRFIRLSPIYYIIIWFYATFLEYLGDGPGWDHNIKYHVDVCRENWLYSILYINNYVNGQHVCVTPSWFLACDMQLCVLAPLVVLPLFRWRRGRQLLAALIAASVLVTAATVILLDLPGILRFHDTDYNIGQFWLENHIPTHVHASPYLVGVFLGYILHRMKTTKITLSKGHVALGWAVAMTMFAAISIGPYYMLQRDYQPTLLERVAYPALGRMFWAVGICWVVFACVAGYGGLLNRFFNCYALRVISRLTYTTNLTQFVLLLHISGRRRVPLWTDEFVMVESFIAHYGVAFLTATVLFLIIESPIYLTSRRFLFKGTFKKKQSSHELVNSNKNK